MKAVPGMRIPKKIHDHKPFKISWPPKKSIGAKAFRNPFFLQTRHAQKAIVKYNTDQTGPKIRSGGVKKGFASPAYQLFTEGQVCVHPNQAVPKQTAGKRNPAMMFFKNVMVNSFTAPKSQILEKMARARCRADP